MKFESRYKFYASLDSNGDITPAAAVLGYQAPTLTGDAIGYHILLEDPATSDWQICVYDPNQSAGSRRTMIYESTTFPHPKAGLVGTLIAPQSSYVASAGSTASPYVDSPNSVAVGGGAGVGTSSENSVVVGEAVTTSYSHSTLVGSATNVTGERATAIGQGAYANAENYDPGTGATAVGADAQTTSMGGTALGSKFGPHVEFIPLQAPAGCDVAGTYNMLAVGGWDGSVYGTHDLQGKCIVSGTGKILQGVRFQGTITATASSAADHKTWDVDYFIDDTAVRWSNFTVKHNGANNIAISFAINAGTYKLEVTTPTTSGLVISGMLTATKIVY